ncbi:MAG TPA: ABC transporter permease [Verrucomicrobiae bacterium]|nr:ABC transporter permease [Verrucomicrobiae bacterium]
MTTDKAHTLRTNLEAIQGVRAYPVYAEASSLSDPPASVDAKGIVSCQALAALAAFGNCPPGSQVATMQVLDVLLKAQLDTRTTHPLPEQRTLSAYSSNHVLAFFVQARDASALERARTHLYLHAAQASPPRTYGEQFNDSLTQSKRLRQIVNISMVVTLIIAGSSLAVSTLGSLFERRRTFTLLRLSGTSMTTLRQVVIMETVAPLLICALLSIGTGYVIAYAMTNAIDPGPMKALSLPTNFYITLGMGLPLSIIIICATLPLLRRITQSENARYE